jgi:transposase
MLQPLVRRTWAPCGQTPIQRSWDRRDRLSVLSAITLAPRRKRIGLYFDIHTHNITTDEVYRFVLAIRQRLRRGIIMVWDRWNVHRSAARRLQQRCPSTIQIEWLPAYAPDLNPTEQVWNHSKYSDLANFVPEHIGHLEHELLDSLYAMRCAPDLLRSFFHTAVLVL